MHVAGSLPSKHHFLQLVERELLQDWCELIMGKA